MCVDENIPLDFVKGVAQKHGVSFGGNLQLTVVLLMGSEDDVRRHTLETLTLAAIAAIFWFRAAICPIACRRPIWRAVAELVHDPYQRDVARKLLEKQQGKSNQARSMRIRPGVESGGGADHPRFRSLRALPIHGGSRARRG